MSISASTHLSLSLYLSVCLCLSGSDDTIHYFNCSPFHHVFMQHVKNHSVLYIGLRIFKHDCVNDLSKIDKPKILMTNGSLIKVKTFEVRKVSKIRNRYHLVPHLTQDATWESDKNTIKHHKREPRGQPFPSQQ